MIDVDAEYIFDSWYVAGLSSDFKQSLKSLKLLEESIVFFRTKSGEPVALEDACPHRKLPLSFGRLDNGVIECGYH